MLPGASPGRATIGETQKIHTQLGAARDHGPSVGRKQAHTPKNRTQVKVGKLDTGLPQPLTRWQEVRRTKFTELCIHPTWHPFLFEDYPHCFVSLHILTMFST